MKKKIFVIILIICLLVIAHIGMYITDRIRMKQNKPVIFSNWGYSYVPPINLPQKELETAILNNIVKSGDSEKHHQNAKTFASMKIYLIEEEKKDELYTIYAWVLQEQYYVENDEIKQEGGSSIPYKFVLYKPEDEFLVTDKIRPGDGSYYRDDMNSIFPRSVREDMEEIHSDGTIEELKADIQKQKEQYFNK